MSEEVVFISCALCYEYSRLIVASSASLLGEITKEITLPSKKGPKCKHPYMHPDKIIMRGGIELPLVVLVNEDV